MEFYTADLCDAHPTAVRCMEPIFSDFGGRISFAGPAYTLKVFEDNSLVRSALEGQGEGRVLVVDGGGSLRCALLGDQLASLAMENDWGGLIIYGCIRDSDAIAEMDIGLKALTTCPVKSVKREEGQRGLSLHFAGVRIDPGDWVYADADGIVVAASALHR